MCFVDFSTPSQAAVAFDCLQGENSTVNLLNAVYDIVNLIFDLFCFLPRKLFYD